MKKIAFLALTSMFIGGVAMADQPLAPNPNAKSQGSCFGVDSSQVKHYGPTVSEQAQSGQRSADVHAIQAACPPN